ncbi:MAG: hypothetical protein V1729_03535 [Candidatus Woesearchaeota archaeon]
MIEYDTSLIGLCEYDSDTFKAFLRYAFNPQGWVNAFIENSHHGLGHGESVREGAISLACQLTDDERAELEQDGREIDDKDPIVAALAAVNIAAVLHDCGRMDVDGNMPMEQQPRHHIVGADRAEYFCNALDSPDGLTYHVRAAVISHDYQGVDNTPEMFPPTTMIGKLVQAVDQLLWFNPISVDRTMNFSRDLRRKFYDPDIPLEVRLSWGPGKGGEDAMTVLLCQYFGPTDSERFGVESARKKAEDDQLALYRRILEVTAEQGVDQKEIIRLFAAYSTAKKDSGK